MAGDGQDVQGVVQEDDRVIAGQTRDKPFVETVDHVLVGLRLVSGVHVHRQGVQLLQGRRS